MKLGIDMDNVLVDFIGSALPRIEQLWGVYVEYENILEPKIEAAINDELIHPVSGEALCTALFQPGFFASMLPRVGAVEALKRLVQQGHEIIIVTRAHMTAGHVVQEKAVWLAQHLKGIDYQLVVVGSGGTKHMINVDVLVDDEPGNLEHPTAVSVCAVHPWNLKYLESKDRKQPVHILHTMGFLPALIYYIEHSKNSDDVFDEAEILLN